MATVSQDCQKVFAKKKLAQECANDRNAKQDRNLGKTEQQVVNNLFGALLQLKSKNSELDRVFQLYIACCVKNSDQKDDLVILYEFFRGADRICFLDSMSQLCFPRH